MTVISGGVRGYFFHLGFVIRFIHYLKVASRVVHWEMLLVDVTAVHWVKNWVDWKVAVMAVWKELSSVVMKAWQDKRNFYTCLHTARVVVECTHCAEQYIRHLIYLRKGLNTLQRVHSMT